MDKKIGIALSEDRKQVVLSCATPSVALDADEVESLLLDLAATHMRMPKPWVAGVGGTLLTSMSGDAA